MTGRLPKYSGHLTDDESPATFSRRHCHFSLGVRSTIEPQGSTR